MQQMTGRELYLREQTLRQFDGTWEELYPFVQRQWEDKALDNAGRA